MTSCKCRPARFLSTTQTFVIRTSGNYRSEKRIRHRTGYEFWKRKDFTFHKGRIGAGNSTLDREDALTRLERNLKSDEPNLNPSAPLIRSFSHAPRRGFSDAPRALNSFLNQ